MQGARQDKIRIVSEELDKMQGDMQKSFAPMSNGEDSKKNDTVVKLVRSRRETRINFIFKGNLEETEDRLQRLCKVLKEG